jgi:hypothetical protein
MGKQPGEGVVAVLLSEQQFGDIVITDQRDGIAQSKVELQGIILCTEQLFHVCF